MSLSLAWPTDVDDHPRHDPARPLVGLQCQHPFAALLQCCAALADGECAAAAVAVITREVEQGGIVAAHCTGQARHGGQVIEQLGQIHLCA